MNSFTPTIIARYVRVHPLTGGPSGIGGPTPVEFCIRAELYAKHAGMAKFHCFILFVKGWET